jgi:sodium transport system permease protein
MIGRNAWVVCRKELTDGLRDRRSLMSALMFPLVGPILIAVMFNYIAESHSTEKPLELPVVGSDNAPGLVAHLEDAGVEIVSPPADPQAAVREGELDVVLLIPDEFEQDFRAARSARLELVVDSSRTEARTPIRRARRLLERYNAEIGAYRLLVRGVHPEVAKPLTIAEVDLATPEKIAANMLNVVPMFVLMAAFIGGMYVATDGTAGERERGSLEPLLLTPASRLGLVLGKWGATTSLALVGLLLTSVGSAIALAQVPLENIGVSLDLRGPEAALLLAIVVPLAPLAAAVQLLVATFARSFREAQTYLSILMLVPMLPGVVLSIHPIGSEAWMSVVPVLGQQALVMDVLRGEVVPPAYFVVAGGTALVLALVAVRLTAWLFEREKIVFGS